MSGSQGVMDDPQVKVAAEGLMKAQVVHTYTYTNSNLAHQWYYTHCRLQKRAMVVAMFAPCCKGVVNRRQCTDLVELPTIPSQLAWSV